MLFPAPDIIKAIKQALDDGRYNIAKNLFLKNRKMMEQTSPDDYKNFSLIFAEKNTQ